jgi:SM-20-related protein
MPDWFFLDVLDAAACEEFVTELRLGHGAAATVYGIKATGTVESAIRKATRIVPAPAMRDRVLRRLVEHTSAIEDHFGLALGEPEEPHFLRYQEGDYFVAHQDGNTGLVLDDSRFRRISVILFLSPQSESPTPGTYSGGSLVLHGSYPDFDLRFPIAAQPGTLVAFRSETTHEVTPVTHGERYTVASWYPMEQGSRGKRHDSPVPEARTVEDSRTMTSTDSALLARIIDFIRSLGIVVTEARVDRNTLVPGIDIRHGGLIVEKQRMCKPADLLHEAAHLALTPALARPALDGTINSTPSDEMSAIAWTWAAAKHLEIDPREVFHEEVISGNGPTLLENFSAGRYVGVPMLQYWRMTLQKSAEDDDTRPYPHMIRWTRDS